MADKSQKGRQLWLDPWKRVGIYARDLMGEGTYGAANWTSRRGRKGKYKRVVGTRQVAEEYGVSKLTVGRIRRQGLSVLGTEEEG
jgi:hypothetical protein